ERLSPAVDAELTRLAAQRRARHPLRHYLGLPLQRVWNEWRPMPEWELPVRVHWLGLPQHRDLYVRLEQLLFALGLLGAALLVRRDGKLVALVVAAVLTRTLLLAYTHPFPVERYLVEAFPGLMALSGYGAI